MTTTLRVIKNSGKTGRDLQVVQFYGGKAKGKMVQLTQGTAIPHMGVVTPGFIQLTKEDALALVKELTSWLGQQ